MCARSGVQRNNTAVPKKYFPFHYNFSNIPCSYLQQMTPESSNNLYISVIEALKGDTQAFSRLYKAYSGTMFNLCYRITGDRAKAHDALQNAFVIAWEQLRNLKEAERFGGWLKQITVREAVRLAKEHARWETLDDGMDIGEEDTGVWWGDIDPAWIQEAILHLPDGCKTVFTLYAIEDYPHKEIAVLMGISESTSKTQYKRAKLLLKERLLKKVKRYGQV